MSTIIGAALIAVGLVVVANAISNAIEDLSEKVEALAEIVIYQEDED
jgi:hypothetical protein